MYSKVWLLFVIAFVQCDSAFPRSNRGDPGGGVIVQLFRWRFDDIARECEQFLAPKGYAAVEVAPITEHWVITGARPTWDEPYYPVSYNILSRSGDETSFRQMVQRCNKVGIKVYVSVVLAYMPKETDVLHGYGGSTANSSKYDYPAVPYDESDFNQPPCYVRSTNTITKQDASAFITVMRLCDQRYDHHLNHTKPKVRRTLRNYLNKLISLGVAGFSIDSVNRIHPDHLQAIFSRLRYLNTSHGFACESEPYIYQEYDTVKSYNDIAAKEYCALGLLADYEYRYHVNRAFHGYKLLSNLQNTIITDRRTNFLPDDKALVFIDSQTAQKKTAAYWITYYARKSLIPATAFMLAYPLGQPRIASSFDYEYLSQPPPIKDNLIEPVMLNGENCTGKWVCEHRWPEIYNMINFRNVVGDANVTNIWNDGNDNLAFSRGDKGFILFNGDYWIYRDFTAILQTGLPSGEYCDVITGTLKDNKCTGKTISVDDKGYATFYRTSNEVGVTAIHVEAKLK